MVNVNLSYPENFLHEETKCDHVISEEMKKVWLVQLDLLSELDRVCKKYDLKYCAMGGTMLGAVRHNGFIPWDDDLDVMMERDHYEKLCEIAKNEFSHPYFFQTQYSDFGATYGHAKFRNSETTCIFTCDLKYKKTVNQGIFIDIFPLDHVIDDKKRFIQQKKKAHFLMKLSKFFATGTKEAYRYHENFIARFMFKTMATLFSPLNKYLSLVSWKSFEKECQKYNDQATEKISPLAFSFDKRWMFDRKNYEDIQYMPFEFIQVPVCKDYEHILTTCYGDWHKFVKGGSMHEVYINPNYSYIKYFNNQSNP